MSRRSRHLKERREKQMINLIYPNAQRIAEQLGDIIEGKLTPKQDDRATEIYGVLCREVICNVDERKAQAKALATALYDVLCDICGMRRYYRGI